MQNLNFVELLGKLRSLLEEAIPVQKRSERRHHAR